MSEPSIIEYSLDGGLTWHHGRTVEAWVTSDADTLSSQRAVVREFAREWHGNVERVVTRVLPESDSRAVLSSPRAEAGGYTDRHSIDCRANSALLAVEGTIADRTVPAAVRLAKVAERLASEPILTDTSPAAYVVRREASARGLAR